MQPTILQALAALDVANDENWTTEGLPRLDVLKDLTGQQITRVALQELAPGFSRVNPVLPQTQAQLIEPQQAELQQAVTTVVNNNSSNETNENEFEEDEEAEEAEAVTLAEHIAKLEALREEAQVEVSRATLELNKVSKQLDVLYRERDKQTTDNARELAASTIAQYQAAQMKARMAAKG